MLPKASPTKSPSPERYPIELFMDPKFSEPYQCTICQMVPIPDQASNHAKCGAIFCKSCLDSWLMRHKDCPKCRGAVKPNLTKNDNHIVYQLHQNLVLRCPNSEACGWKGPFSNIELHKKECGYIKKPCKYSVAGCQFQGTAESLKEHEQIFKYEHLTLCLATIHDLKKAMAQKKTEEEIMKCDEDPVARLNPKSSAIHVDNRKKYSSVQSVAMVPVKIVEGEEHKESRKLLQKEKHELFQQRQKLKVFQRQVREELGGLMGQKWDQAAEEEQEDDENWFE